MNSCGIACTDCAFPSSKNANYKSKSSTQNMQPLLVNLCNIVHHLQYMHQSQFLKTGTQLCHAKQRITPSQQWCRVACGANRPKWCPKATSCQIRDNTTPILNTKLIIKTPGRAASSENNWTCQCIKLNFSVPGAKSTFWLSSSPSWSITSNSSIRMFCSMLTSIAILSSIWMLNRSKIAFHLSCTILITNVSRRQMQVVLECYLFWKLLFRMTGIYLRV